MQIPTLPSGTLLAIVLFQSLRKGIENLNGIVSCPAIDEIDKQELSNKANVAQGIRKKIVDKLMKN